MNSTIKTILSYLPSKLPTGNTRYTAWLNEVTDLAGPIADVDSMQWVISNEVMRLASTKDRAPKAYFVKVLRKYAANQLAANKVMELKTKQQEAQNAAKLAEATAQQETATSEQTKETTN